MKQEIWIQMQLQLPPENIEVLTKIHDKKGSRNIQQLTRVGTLFFGDPGNYIYSTPTHWQNINSHPSEET